MLQSLAVMGIKAKYWTCKSKGVSIISYGFKNPNNVRICGDPPTHQKIWTFTMKNPLVLKRFVFFGTNGFLHKNTHFAVTHPNLNIVLNFKFVGNNGRSLSQNTIETTIYWYRCPLRLNFKTYENSTLNFNAHIPLVSRMCIDLWSPLFSLWFVVNRWCPLCFIESRLHGYLHVPVVSL